MMPVKFYNVLGRSEVVAARHVSIQAAGACVGVGLRRIKHSARLTFHLKAPGLRLHTDVIKLQTLHPRLLLPATPPHFPTVS